MTPDHVAIAAQMLWIPLSCPLRNPVDRVLVISEAVRSGEATPSALLSFAADLRDETAGSRHSEWMRATYCQ